MADTTNPWVPKTFLYDAEMKKFAWLDINPHGHIVHDLMVKHVQPLFSLQRTLIRKRDSNT